MPKFQITSRSGVWLGTYEAHDEGEALDAMARDAGYEDYADACEVTGDQALTVTRYEP